MFYFQHGRQIGWRSFERDGGRDGSVSTPACHSRNDHIHHNMRNGSICKCDVIVIKGAVWKIMRDFLFSVLERLWNGTSSSVPLTETWRFWWQDENGQFIDIVHRYVRRLGMVQDSVASHTAYRLVMYTLLDDAGARCWSHLCIATFLLVNKSYIVIDYRKTLQD